MTDAEEPAPPRLRRALPERAARAFLPACVGEWLVAEGMHLSGVPWLDLGLGTAAAATAAHSWIGRKAKDKKNAWRHARNAAWGITAAGGWLTAADGLGPLAGPHGALTWTWAALSLGGAWKFSRHELVATARDWRLRREGWHATARDWGLAGSFLLHHETTRLGEMMIADVTGTGRLASEIARSSLPERIAQSRGLPRNRVEVKEAPGPAGRVMINIRETDPWKHAFTHPVLADRPEIDLRAPYSITQLAVVGQVPETGEPISLPVCGETGGKVISVVGQQDAGKTTLLNCLCERVTAAPDAILIRLNLSFKGDSERSLWAPACLLTALGDTKDAAKRATRILKLVCEILRERSKRPKATANFVPSRDNPLIVVMIDEVDAAVTHSAILKLLETVASKGREYGATLITAGQRGTAEWQGSANIRALQNVVCLGMVKASGEAMHAAGDAGLTMPNMAEYGEGRPGVWVIGGTAVPRQQAGRAFNLSDPEDIRRLVRERAYFRPVLPEWIAEALGDDYAQLLGSDVFAEWARDHSPPLVSPGMPPTPAAPSGEGARAPVAVLDDVIAEYDREAEEHMSGLDDADDLRARLRKINAKNIETTRIVNEVSEPLPDIPADQLAAFREQRWKQLGEETEIAGEQRSVLLRLLEKGTTVPGVAAELKISKWTARTLIERLRSEGLVRKEGDRRTARWFLAGPEDGDGS